MPSIFAKCAKHSPKMRNILVQIKMGINSIILVCLIFSLKISRLYLKKKCATIENVQWFLTWCKITLTRKHWDWYYVFMYYYFVISYENKKSFSFVTITRTSIYSKLNFSWCCWVNSNLTFYIRHTSLCTVI